MGFWSSLKNKIKKVAKKVWRVVKAVVRVVVRVVMTVIGAVLGIADLLLGFIAWPPKKLRLHIFILSDQNGPLVNPGDLAPAIEYARKTLKDRFNVKLKAYSENFVEIIPGPAPNAALEVHCDSGAFKEEFWEAGEYFAKHLAGWNAIPVSLTFPITAFVVRDIDGKQGCSLGPLSDYVTIDLAGAKSDSTLAHEIGHACSLWHSKTQSNLMWHDTKRGNGAKWFQKNLLRSSRHVMYW
ncbi:MAG: hypothetical protein AAB354_14010 [candidate division KSB1 bacterium]